MTKRQDLWMIAACVVSLHAGAESPDHDHEGADRHQQHGAHVHGVAELTLAQEGDALELALESPADNILGFEHRASTPEQIRAVEEAKAALESPGSLFSFTGTSCELEQVTVDVSAVMMSAEDEHHGHHEKHHGHHEKEEHDDHEDTHEGEETHSDLSASYHYVCENGSQLKSVSVDLLDNFSRIETLNAMWVTETGQGAAELNAQSRTINLR